MTADCTDLKPMEARIPATASEAAELKIAMGYLKTAKPYAIGRSVKRDSQRLIAAGGELGGL
jgi:hypothetical protein